MKFGYAIVDVKNVGESRAFFERAFGLKRRFLHESATYGEVETGATTLSFAQHELAASRSSAGPFNSPVALRAERVYTSQSAM